MQADRSASAAPGVCAALAAFFLWGLLPMYWKRLGAVAPLDVVSCRVLSSLFLLLPVLLVTGRLRHLRDALASRRQLIWHICSGILLGINWFLYIYATLTNQIIEGALGYFLNPLINVAIGWLLLGEKSTPRQILALAIAGVGVLLQAVAVARLPWIALGLAFSFAFYGFARKQSTLGALDGLAMETVLMSPFAVLALWLAPVAAILERSSAELGLLLCSGLATTIPLLFFAYGARRLRMTTLGILQFLVPTLQFTLGRWVYGEPVSLLRFLSFVCIWLAIALFLYPQRGQPKSMGKPDLGHN